MQNIIVYVKTDGQGGIIAVNSSAFLTDTKGWTQIDEGTEWPKYMHAQGNYFPQPIMTEDGICRYKLVDGQAAERSEAEIQAERDARPAPPPTDTERIDNLETNKADKTELDALNILLGVSDDE